MSIRMASAPQKHLISVDEYYRMAEVGLLAPNARVELIEGEIIDMPHGELHTFRSPHLGQYLERRITRDPGVMTLKALPDIGIDLARLFAA